MLLKSSVTFLSNISNIFLMLKILLIYIFCNFIISNNKIKCVTYSSNFIPILTTLVTMTKKNIKINTAVVTLTVTSFYSSIRLINEITKF